MKISAATRLAPVPSSPYPLPGTVAPLVPGEPVPRVVTGCRGCPFFEERGYYCNRAAKYGVEQDEDQRVIQAGRSPSWCPLRTAPVLVRLRVP